MKRRISVAVGVVAVVAALSASPAAAGKGDKSVGKTTIDTAVDAGINYGTGIDNGEWVTAEIKGIEIGLRATDRTDGLLDVTRAKGNRVGVYEASTGLDADETDRAEWNYEFHVDLSRAVGNAAGTTLADYSLELEQDFVPGVGATALPMPFVCDAATDTLCQQSWNPMMFGATSAGYDPAAEATYNLRLVLIPETFSGPALAVAIQVNVTN